MWHKRVCLRHQSEIAIYVYHTKLKFKKENTTTPDNTKFELKKKIKKKKKLTTKWERRSQPREKWGHWVWNKQSISKVYLPSYL
jgi:hypothetical protein